MTIKELLKDYQWNYNKLIEAIKYLEDEFDIKILIKDKCEEFDKKNKNLPIRKTILSDINNLYLGFDVNVTYKGYFKQLNNLLTEVIYKELYMEYRNYHPYISFYHNFETTNHICRLNDTCMIAEELLKDLDLPENKGNVYRDKFFQLNDL